MKIIVMGAGGKIGVEVISALAPNHTVISTGREVDYTDAESVRSMYRENEDFDGLVCVVGGDSVFKSFEELTDDDFAVGFQRKFMAQLNLVRIGTEFIIEGGSFTLSTGFLSHYPNPFSVATGPFNAAMDCAVMSIAPLMPRGIGVNVVSPAPVVPPDRAGRGLISAAQAAPYYVQCVEGDMTGQVLRAWGGLENVHA